MRPRDNIDCYYKDSPPWLEGYCPEYHCIVRGADRGTVEERLVRDVRQAARERKDPLGEDVCFTHYETGKVPNAE